MGAAPFLGGRAPQERLRSEGAPPPVSVGRSSECCAFFPVLKMANQNAFFDALSAHLREERPQFPLGILVTLFDREPQCIFQQRPRGRAAIEAQ